MIARMVGFEVGLEDPVKLQFLPGRDPKRPAADRGRQGVAGEILGRGALAAGHGDPDHELEGLFLPLALHLGADIAVILLVGPMELEDGRGVLGEVGRAVGHLVGDELLEVAARLLDRLDLAERLVGSLTLHVHRVRASWVAPGPAEPDPGKGQ